MRFSKFVGAAVLGGAGLFSVAARCQAGINVVSSDRLVGTAVNYSELGGPLESPSSTTTVGAFHADKSSSVGATTDDPGTDVRLTHTSAVGSGGVRVSGTIEVDAGPEVATYQSHVDVLFDVSAPTPFTLGSSLAFTDYHSNNPGFGSTEPYVLKLSRVGMDPSNIVSKTLESSTNLEFLLDPKLSVSESGTLEPGQYRLLFDVKGDFNYNMETGGKYSLNFAVGGGGTPPNAVPLPPAVWAGGFTLAGLALTQWRRRKIAVAAE